MLTPEQREHFDTHGYLIIEDALAPIGLDRVAAAYERVQSLTEPAWRQSVADGTFRGGYGNGPDAHTMSSPYTQEPIFLDLANNPAVIPLLEEIVGPELQAMEIVCHCHHAGARAHTGWHRDWPPWTHPKYILKAKVFYFLDDQDEDMGCFSLVPGTHRLPDGPPKEQYTGPTLEAMPGFKRIAPPAGSAIIWNVLCWHSGLANTSQRDRRMIIYGYMPFWVKKWVSEPPPQLMVDWADTPQKRQIMGIHCVHGRAGWDRKDIPYLPEHEPIARAKKL
jgi:ectoine hydroxylase-related dioxygenase (phytanoyl-CoA dioxygenase family)